MARITIPARTDITCDSCGALTHKDLGIGRRLRAGVLVVRRDALDLKGEPAGDDTITCDLCDACLDKVVEVIQKVMTTQKAIAEVRAKK